MIDVVLNKYLSISRFCPQTEFLEFSTSVMIATFNKILLAFLDISDKQNYCCVSDSFKKDVISSPSNKKVAKLTIKKPELCH